MDGNQRNSYRVIVKKIEALIYSYRLAENSLGLGQIINVDALHIFISR